MNKGILISITVAMFCSACVNPPRDQLDKKITDKDIEQTQVELKAENDIAHSNLRKPFVLNLADINRKYDRAGLGQILNLNSGPLYYGNLLLAGNYCYEGKQVTVPNSQGDFIELKSEYDPKTRSYLGTVSAYRVTDVVKLTEVEKRIFSEGKTDEEKKRTADIQAECTEKKEFVSEVFRGEKQSAAFSFILNEGEQVPELFDIILPNTVENRELILYKYHPIYLAVAKQSESHKDTFENFYSGPSMSAEILKELPLSSLKQRSLATVALNYLDYMDGKEYKETGDLNIIRTATFVETPASAAKKMEERR